MAERFYEDPEVLIQRFVRDDIQYIRKEVKPMKIMGINLDSLAERLCEREIKILDRLKGIDGIPQVIEQDSPTSFIYQYIDGKMLLEVKKTPERYFDKLEALLNKVHERGVADIDFGDGEGILVRPDGSAAILDFAVAIVYDPNQGIRSKIVKPFFKYFCRLNREYLLRSKERRAPEELTPDELKEAHDIGSIERIWKTYQRIRKFVKYDLLKMSRATYFSKN
ncbi:MAG: hypothetical protein ABIJ08_02265 [Nanoarchaeota archaeon]